MPVIQEVVDELRTLFKRGATPSAVIRRIAERHAGEPQLDVLVRAYFRKAFDTHAVRVGPEQVAAIAAGEGLAALNTSVVRTMVQARADWDDDPDDGSWLDAVSAVGVDDFDLSDTPQLDGVWDHLDDTAKEYIRRTISNARDLSNRVNALAALAERLQEQVEAATRAPAVPAAA